VALQLFDVVGGYSIDEVAEWITGTGIPGSGVNDSTAQTAQVGAIYQRTNVGNVSVYLKISAGATTANWLQLADQDYVDNSIQTLEWQDSVLDKDLTAPPGSPSVGDRYLIGLDPTAGTATGAWAGQDGQIAEWNGTSWDFTAPTTGMFISADDESTLLYYYNGTLWTSKAFESTTASTGLVKVGNDIQLDSSAAGAGLGYAAGVLSVNVDDLTLEIVTDTLQVKADGINDTHIDWGLGVNQVNASDLPYDNTTSGLVATDTQAAIDELDARLDIIDGAQTNTLGNTGGVEITADSVLVDDVAAVTWHVHVLDTTTGDVEFAIVSAIHDGSSDGVTDATAATFNVNSKLRDSNVAGDVFSVDVNGTGAGQEMRLRMNANNTFDVRALKAEVIVW
jgi:hypothetical protein